MRITRMFGSIAALGLLAVALSGCTTMGSGRVSSRDQMPIVNPPIVQQVVSPYDAAKRCIARIPRVADLKIGVGAIRDLTGKVNTATDEGTGDFVTQGASDMMISSLSSLGVQVVEVGPVYKATVDWFMSKGSKGALKMPQFILDGSVDALDFGQTSSAFQAQLFGFGPNIRAYAATGRMDLRLTTMPEGHTIGGQVPVTSAFTKVFVAKESGIGLGTFVGNGSGLTFASFQIGSDAREPMQETIGFMADYGASDLILNLLGKLHAAPRAQVDACRKLLVDPYGPAIKEVRVAEAARRS